MRPPPAHARALHLRLGLALLISIAALFWPVLLCGRPLLTGDCWCEFLPMRSLAWEAIRHGQLPLWTPNMASGYPLMAMAQNAVAYPLTWFYAVGPVLGEQVYLISPFVLAPLFTYLLGRRLGMSELGAFVAGMSYGFGGFMASSQSNNAVLQHVAAWLPLALLCVDYGRTRPWLPCTLAGSVPIAMACLGGYIGLLGYVVLFVLAYGVSASLRSRGITPLVVALGSTALGLSLCAFQLLETLAVVPLSVRAHPTWQGFTAASLDPVDLLESWLLGASPSRLDVMTHLSVLALLLACVGALAAWRARAPRFWVGLALFGFLAMLGGNGPFYGLLFHVPILRSLRFPTRHGLEFTLSLAVLAGFGWDICARRLRARRHTAISTALLVLSALAVLPWALNVDNPQGYVLWKAVSSALLLAAILLSPGSRKSVLLIAAVCLATVPEPTMMFTRWFYSIPSTDPWRPTDTTRFLLEATSRGRDLRVYTQVNPFFRRDTVDPPDRSCAFGLREAAGYEPLFLTRYADAMAENGYGPTWAAADETPLAARSHVLDLLNVGYVVIGANDHALPVDRFVARSGQQGASIEVVSTMTYAAPVEQGAWVARVDAVMADGVIVPRLLRAGIETAETAFDRPDLRPRIHHEQAPLRDRDGEGLYHYHARFDLADEIRAHGGLSAVDIHPIVHGGPQVLAEQVRLDAEALARAPHWVAVHDPRLEKADRGLVFVYRNLHPRPRAWLVGEVQAVDGAEALARIRGTGRPFDPATQALIESAAIPPVAGAGGTVTLTTDEPARLAYDVEADAPSFLVTSELWFPGWVATVDGAEAPIIPTDYLLRGVAMPAGKHRVVMVYTAPALRLGAAVSLAALALLGLGLWRWRRHGR